MIKIGSALPSPMTSSMRDFGASRDVRRPDVGSAAAVPQSKNGARAEQRSVGGLGTAIRRSMSRAAHVLT